MVYCTILYYARLSCAMLCYARIQMPIVKPLFNESWPIEDGKLLRQLSSLQFVLWQHHIILLHVE